MQNIFENYGHLKKPFLKWKLLLCAEGLSLQTAASTLQYIILSKMYGTMANVVTYITELIQH